MSLYREIASILESGRSLVLVTVVDTSSSSPGREGFKLAVAEDGELRGTVGGGALEHRAVELAREMLGSGPGGAAGGAEAGAPRLVELDLAALGMECGGKATLLFERLAAQEPFVLFGGGHVGRALAPLLEGLGYRVTVFDDREAVRAPLAGTAGGPAAGGPSREVVIGPFADISPVAPRLAAGGRCFIATHGHEHDSAVLRQLLRLEVGWSYIGMIGSRRKVRAALERLRGEGLAVPPQLYAPVGLDLGGGSPAEIAVAVAAELIALRHGRPVPHLRDA